MNNTSIFPGYTALTYDDFHAACRLNAKNGYGFTKTNLSTLAKNHKKARAAGDIRTMEKIECRLTDANFHPECSMLRRSEYKKLLEELKSW